MKSDCDKFYRKTVKDAIPVPRRGTSMVVSQYTLFSQERKFALFVFDEAHYARTYNILRVGTMELSRRARMTIALTATPVMTSPTVSTVRGCQYGSLLTHWQDLVNLARLLQLSGVVDSSMDAHRREVDRARRDERKKRNEGKGEIRLARAVATGKQTKDADEDRVKIALSDWINELRAIFDGSMIRRTVNSLDYKGEPISGLPKWIELPILIELSDEEMAVQEQLAEGLVSEGAKATVKAVQVSLHSQRTRGRHSRSDAPRAG